MDGYIFELILHKLNFKSMKKSATELHLVLSKKENGKAIDLSWKFCICVSTHPAMPLQFSPTVVVKWKFWTLTLKTRHYNVRSMLSLQAAMSLLPSPSRHICLPGGVCLRYYPFCKQCSKLVMKTHYMKCCQLTASFAITSKLKLHRAW